MICLSSRKLTPFVSSAPEISPTVGGNLGRVTELNLTDEHVLVSSRGGLGRITLNRPRALNALSLDMIRTISGVLDDWRENTDVEAIVIDSTDPRGLCAGGDVRALREAIIAGQMHEAAEFFRAEYAMNAAIAEYPKPIVAIANGITMGGGIGIAGHASHRIVTETSKLAMPETRIGFTPDVGGTWLLAHAPGRLGEYLGLTGTTMNESDAIATGFADYFVPFERVSSLIEALETRADPSTVTELILLFDETAEPSTLVAEGGWIDDAFGRGSVAEIAERLSELSTDAEVGAHAAAALQLLTEMSPTSLAVTLASVRHARTLDGVRAVLAQEFNLADWLWAESNDMVEGIRAQLVDKDRNPHFSPATIAEVPADTGARALAHRATPPLWN